LFIDIDFIDIDIIDADYTDVGSDFYGKSQSTGSHPYLGRPIESAAGDHEFPSSVHTREGLGEFRFQSP
jgi:hypothetical protein